MFRIRLQSKTLTGDPVFWAKTRKPTRLPGISVRDHCVNVGCVAEALLAGLAKPVRGLLPAGAATLAAAHDIGKITIGFQAKCPQWLLGPNVPSVSSAQATFSVSDHAAVSQYFLQQSRRLPASLWAVAVGAHHGRPKGRIARLSAPEELQEWADGHRLQLLDELEGLFGRLPATKPVAELKEADLWLLAGLITVADWIGSNENWFSAAEGLPIETARAKARVALDDIGWPGGCLSNVSFSEAFTGGAGRMLPNPVQGAVMEAASSPGLIIVEGPMGCGKTEAALYAALQLISTGKQHGIYFALPTQVTSNRIHRRVAKFLGFTLGAAAALRLAHGNAWLEDDFDLKLQPAFGGGAERDQELDDSIREARSWFASSKQALLAPYGVGTVDQALQGIVAVKHFFVRRFALAGKVVILDEVHSYDIYTGTLITALIRELMSLGCTVIVLSATLTAARRNELLTAGKLKQASDENEYPMVTAGRGAECKSLKPEWRDQNEVRLRVGPISEEEAAAELIERAEAGQQVLWIRNTVIEAQESYKTIRSSIRAGAAGVGLLHSRFPHQRRAELEEEWLERLGKDQPRGAEGSILIATQVVEQSVDIDVDFLISDLAPTDMLLQRVGRLWRHERRGRPATKPEFWVRLPEIPQSSSVKEVKRALGRSGRVYAPYVLLRTAEAWSYRGERSLKLPKDIRPILEETYAEQETEQGVFKELRNELEKERAELAMCADAATRVLGRPMLQDEEEVLTRRRGAPTVTIVMVRSVRAVCDQGVTVEALDGTESRISNYEWRRAAARFLQNSSVRIPRWFAPALAAKPRWLTLHAPAARACVTVQDDGRCIFGEEKSATIYDRNLGVAVEEETRVPAHRCDDDDEFDY